jgi:hypothetical protein
MRSVHPGRGLLLVAGIRIVPPTAFTVSSLSAKIAEHGDVDISVDSILYVA